MEEYQLAQSSVDFSPNLILAKATRESEKLTFGFKEDFLQYDLRVSMPGCVAPYILRQRLRLPIYSDS